LATFEVAVIKFFHIMRINVNYFLSFLFLVFTGSCQTESDLVTPTLDYQLSSNLTTADFEFGVATAKIDFDKGNFEAGDIVSKIYCPDGQGPITVMGLNPDFNDNAAMIFDSSNPTGDDEDLGTPNESFGGPGKAYNSDPVPSNSLALNNVLIVSEDLDSSDPNDASITGVALWLDFSALGLVTLYAMDVLDVNNPAYVQLLDADDNELLKVDLPITGDNGLAMVDLGPTSGVVKMHVVLNGSGASSGAIDNICFEKEEETGCTFTLGYWKNHANSGDNKYNPTWELLGPLGKNEPLFLSEKTYFQAISAGGGNAYYQLSQQYVAAVLNALGGASTTVVNSELTEAKNLFETYTPAQIGALQGNNPTRKKFIGLSEILDKYNNGRIGPGHCDKQGND